MSPLRSPSQPVGVEDLRRRPGASNRQARVRRGVWIGLTAATLVALAGVVGLGAAASPALAADNCANAEFRTGWSAKLPDCRAYEMVTPAEKAGVPIIEASIPYPLPSGDAFLFLSVLPVAGTNPVDRQGQGSWGLVQRTGQGWTANDIRPQACNPYVHGTLTTDFAAATVVADDLRTSLVMQGVASGHCQDPDDQAGNDIYIQDLVDRRLTWISQNGAPKTANVNVTYANGGSIATASRDLRHVFFMTTEKLVPSADAGRVASARGLYERVDRQVTRAVDVDDSGVELSVCGVGTAMDSKAQPVSADGRVVFFSTGTSGDASCAVANGGGRMYARVDGARTVAVTPAPTTAVPRFLAATPDGRFAFFTSKEQLTTGATPGGGLYRADLSRVLDGESVAPALTFLTPQTAAPAGPRIGETLEFTDDGQIVYFVSSNAPLVPGGTSDQHMYRYANGGLTDLGPAAGADRGTLSMSPDGSKIVFGRSVNSTTQLFLSDGGGTPVCVSCPSVGSPTSFSQMDAGSISGRPDFYGRREYVTNEGRVFFQTGDRLVPGDVNDKQDVYEWAAGEHRLLSSGTSTEDSLLLGTSPGGRDVFFLTADSLVARDFDNGDRDVYTARVGGGFAPPVEPAAACVGDGCQVSVPAPVLVAPGSVGFVAPFAPAARTVPAPNVTAKKVSVKRPKSVRGATKVRLSVKVPEAGRIRVSGSGLRRAKKTAKQAKTYRVTVKLSKRSERMLKRKDRVKVRATVRFTPKHGKASRVRVHVTFQQKQGQRAKRRSHDRGSDVGRKGGR